jgi:hypothetical protein
MKGKVRERRSGIGRGKERKKDVVWEDENKNVGREEVR